MPKVWLNDPDADEAFRSLRRARILIDRGWLEQHAFHGTHGWGGHRMVFAGGQDVVLLWDEVRWVSIGYGDGKGGVPGDALMRVDRQAVPDILTILEVARLLNLSEEAIVKRVQNGHYYQVVSNRRASRSIIRAEMEAQESTDPKVEARWWRLLREKLPPATLESQLPPRPVEPEPAIDPTLRDVDRRQELVRIAGRDEGWLRLVRNLGSREYTVELPDATGDMFERSVPAVGLEPYVWGVGLAHDHGELVTYRPAVP